MTINALIKEISSSKRYPLSKINKYAVCNNTAVFDDCSYINKAKIDNNAKTVYLYDDEKNKPYTVEKFLKILQSKPEIGKYTVLLHDYREDSIVKMPNRKCVEVSPGASIENKIGAIVFHTVPADEEETGIFGF